MFKVSVLGCSLCDYLYTNVDFNSKGFQKYMSKRLGDGGLIPGQLVFAEELEIFTNNKSFTKIAKDILGTSKPDAWNVGGPAIVAGINIAQLLENDEYKVSFYGAKGHDKIGKNIVSVVEQTPINIDNYVTVKGITPFTYVLSDPNYHKGKGERTFINNIGAAWFYTPEMINDEFYESDVLLLGATALVPEIHDHLNHILLKGLEHECFNIVSTVFDFRNEKENPGTPWPIGESDDTYRYIDLLIMDWDEAMKMTGARNMRSAAHFLRALGVSAFIVTHGAKDFYIWSSGRSCQQLKLSSLPVCEQADIDLATHPELRGDTTGCGDNFCGGVVAGICQQLKENPDELPDLIEAAAWGAASGGFACFSIGGTYLEKEPGEKRAKVEHYYNSYIKQIGRKRD
jgi:sugar/nucleoside kinase (ribokinase family)